MTQTLHIPTEELEETDQPERCHWYCLNCYPNERKQREANNGTMRTLLRA
jgi:hypothetical protein